MRILDAEAMREVDRAAIEDLGIPGVVLMENAALGVAEAIAAEYPDATCVTLFCGPGNNGGDGLALARLLEARGYLVSIVLVGDREPQGDAAIQLGICRRVGMDLVRLGAGESASRAPELARRADVVVDALFGTGLSRPLSGGYASLVEAINDLSQPCVAVDLPSGLMASHAEPPGPHVIAELTVAFAAPKVAHVFPPSALAAGRVVVADLGIPRRLVEGAPGDLRLASAAELAPLLGVRPPDGHKGDFGHVLVVAGSPGKCGAGILAARAAVRSGAGLVTLAVPAPYLAAVDTASLESMTLALPMAGEGLAEHAVEVLLEAAAGKEAVAVGPGLGRALETERAIRRLVLESSMPMVLDADGLNAFAGAAADLAERDGTLILTPHPGELARLLGVGAAAISADRPAAVREAAAVTGAIVVLKGHLSLVADPLGGVIVNPSGNPGMATGGSGDVLTGVVAALVGQGIEAHAAAALGTYVHGRAGDLAAAAVGERSLAAGDLIERLGSAFGELESA